MLHNLQKLKWQNLHYILPQQKYIKTGLHCFSKAVPVLTQHNTKDKLSGQQGRYAERKHLGQPPSPNKPQTRFHQVPEQKELGFAGGYLRLHSAKAENTSTKRPAPGALPSYHLVFSSLRVFLCRSAQSNLTFPGRSSGRWRAGKVPGGAGRQARSREAHQV